MLAEIALAALLDTAQVNTPAIRETVYVERMINPQAAPKTPGVHDGSKAVQYVVGTLCILGGMGAFIKGLNDRDETVVVDDSGHVKLKKTGWDTMMTVGLSSFAFGIVLAVN